jgi:hypothetical protein
VIADAGGVVLVTSHDLKRGDVERVFKANFFRQKTSGFYLLTDFKHLNCKQIWGAGKESQNRHKGIDSYRI